MTIRRLADPSGVEKYGPAVQQAYDLHRGDRRPAIRICSSSLREAGPPWLDMLPFLFAQA